MRIGLCRLLADEERKAGEGKAAGDVVNYVYLAEIEAGFQGLQRYVNLEDYGFSVGRGDFVRDDGLGFVDFGCALEEFDAGENADRIAGRFCRLRRFCGFGLAGSRCRCCWLGILSLCRVVDFILEIKMLVGRKDVRNVGDEFHLVADQRIGG